MDFESSGSVEEASEYDDTGVIEYIDDSDEEGCGLADAFKQFEAQAEKRTLELLRATDEQLFQVSGDAKPAKDEVKDAEKGNVPAYMYMSDQFRLKKPPQFQDWQQNFRYLQLTGSKMQEGESMEHVQLVPMETKEEEIVQVDAEDIQLQVEGFACLQNPVEDSRGDYEEIILCDGLMEETLEHDENADDEESDADYGFCSPHNSRMEEVLDALTMECFSSTVAPMLASFYKMMLEKQQLSVRIAREEREATANRTVEEQLAIEKAKQLRLDQKAQEEAARIEALEQQRQEEERKAIARREQLLKQQLEESDEDEVKIKTLAYSHTREWYQPNKKCFSHRGRQLTYLKPVLQTKGTEDIPVADTQKHSPPRSSDRRRTRQSNVLKKPQFKLQKPQPEWVTGGALTNDKLCDISWVKKIARPPVNPSVLPMRSRSFRKNGNQREDASGGVQLPIISQNAVVMTPTTGKRSAKSKCRHYPS